MRRATLTGLGLLFLTCAIAVGQPAKADPNRARVEKLGKSFTDAFNRGDAAAVAGMYAEDATAFPPDSDLVKGRAAIQAVWQGFLDMGGKSMKFTVLDVQSSGNVIVETGRADLQVQPPGASAVDVPVKYVVVWKRQKDGSWKISHDIWNSMAPAPAPAAAAPAVTATPAPHH